MKPISRGAGTTASERYLARLADRTFLDLWSFANVFNDNRPNATGDGKELCDLLVVCGDDVIVFSDKSIAWPAAANTNVAWARWYRRAVEKSVAQTRGAARWLRTNADRIYVDAACTERLPIALPQADKMRVHCIAVALGAQQACAAHHQGPDGSLMIRSDLKGADHTDAVAPNYTPFAFGDVDPDGPFVHVFDETALDLVMLEMDTISDFTRYLKARERAIRGGSIAFAPSEADLLAVYLFTDVGGGDHGFPTPEVLGGGPSAQIAVRPGEYDAYLASPERRAKAEASGISYAWDRLIRTFTEHIIAGTSVSVAGHDPDTARAERALRTMALEDRTQRRGLGHVFVEALREAERRGQDRFARIVMPIEGSADPECGYVFLVLACRGLWMEGRSYDEYRELRAGMLRAYCETALYDHRRLKRMLGIAMDASPAVSGREGGSEDCALVEVAEWTPELEARVAETRKGADILNPARLRSGRYTTTEYPEQPEPPPRGNRHERRAALSRRRAEKAAAKRRR